MSSSTIADIAEYRNDAVSALRLYFSSLSPSFGARFLGYSPDEVISELGDRILETDNRSSLAVLISLERAFYIDYRYRLQKKVKGDLFKAFRDMHKSRTRSIRLDDIFEAWKVNVPGSKRLIGELRGAFKFRHWLAHGERWELRANRYDFDSLYDIGATVFGTFEFVTGG
jgi:hypothetical protein